MSKWIQKHFPSWQNLLYVIVAVGGIEGMRAGFGVISRAVDIERLPEVVVQVDSEAKSREAVILATVQTNNVKLDTLQTNVDGLKKDDSTIKLRQEKMIDFINSLSNHPPIEWPATLKSSAVADKDYPDPP